MRVKFGECIDCADGRHVPLTAKRCQRCHARHKAKGSKYVERRNAWLKLSARIRADRPKCEAQLPGCTGRSQEVHHKAGRIGALLLDEAHLMAICHPCHDYIHTRMSRAEAVERGFKTKA